MQCNMYICHFQQNTVKLILTLGLPYPYNFLLLFHYLLRISMIDILKSTIVQPVSYLFIHTFVEYVVTNASQFSKQQQENAAVVSVSLEFSLLQTFIATTTEQTVNWFPVAKFRGASDELPLFFFFPFLFCFCFFSFFLLK